MAKKNALELTGAFVIEAEVGTEVKEALEFARNSPFPAPEDAYQNMYANPFPIAH